LGGAKDGPRFFCEGCGAQVALEVEFCPHCRRRFSSVLCPACGLSGPADAFVAGCPACGHMAPRAQGSKPEAPRSVPVWALALSVGLLALALAALFFRLA